MSKAASGHEKIHRWTDLIAALLSRKSPATFDELVADVPAYKYVDDDDVGDGKGGLSVESVKRTFERDKDELREFGVPIETVEQDPGDNQTSRYQLTRTAFYLPFLVAAGNEAATRKRRPAGYEKIGELIFEPGEIAALASALARLEELRDPVLTEDARFAARTLAFDLPSLSEDASDIIMLGADDGASAQIFEALSRALRSRKTAAFTYQSPSDAQPSQRKVQPYGLFFLNAHWYLAAFDLVRVAMRNFRLSRMSAVSVNKAKPNTPDYEIPPEFRLRAHAQLRQPWELGHAEALVADVQFVGTSGAVATASEFGEPVSGHADRRRFTTVRRFDTFARWLLSFGGDLVPVSPPELVDEYRAQVRATLKHYAVPA